MRQLTSLDAQFLAVESSRTYGHVGGLAIYDPSTTPRGELTVPDLCRLVSERLHLLPPFTWRLVSVPLGLAHPYWIEDPDFDLDFHIRESAVPPPGTDRQLAETVARIFARPLDRNRPLWELYLIHGLPEGRVALLTKIHHSVVDGVSGNEILTVLLDPSPEGREIAPPLEERATESPPGELSMLGRGLLSLPLQPLKALRSAPSALPHLPMLPGASALPGGPTLARGLTRVRRRLGVEPHDPEILEATGARPPKTCFNGPISGHRRFSFGQMSLDRVKAIKNETGTTVNDVVVSLCAGALREWLNERSELPSKPLVALVPVSVRTEDEQGTFGNKVAGMIVPIPTNQADPRRRLKRTHEYLRGAKERHRATPASLLTDATSFIPPAVASLAARTTIELLGRTGRPPVNVVISNVPGPRNPLFIAGAKLEANYPVSVVIDGVGLNITVMSYLDHLDFGIVSDRDQIDDVWPLLDRLRDALDELESATLTVKNRARGSKPKGRASTRG
jgi:diacylglycerol O-acyltransferase / wax synthase